MEKEKVLIAIPAYGGDIKVQCFNSVIKLFQDRELLEKYELELLTAHNDALISRLRQEIAKEAVSRKADKLFFIDADISFTLEQFKKILFSEKSIIGGTYLKKTLAQPGLNFNLMEEKTLEFIKRFGVHPSSVAGFKILKEEYCPADPIIEAKHLATGFLCINREVLEKVSEKANKYLSDRRKNNRANFTPEEIEEMKVAEIFPVSVQNGILESEDWGFCRLCRENGIKLYLHTDVVVEHTGSITFRPQLFGHDY